MHVWALGRSCETPAAFEAPAGPHPSGRGSPRPHFFWVLAPTWLILSYFSCFFLHLHFYFLSFFDFSLFFFFDFFGFFDLFHFYLFIFSSCATIHATPNLVCPSAQLSCCTPPSASLAYSFCSSQCLQAFQFQEHFQLFDGQRTSW